ncbi:transposase family protein [Bacillus cereus]|nr:transposase family protein [Bacillus cereus]
MPFKNNFLYLSVVQDIYNNEIIAWKLSHRNDLQLVLETLDLARKKEMCIGIHSDQGSQYTSHAYHRTLQHLGAIRAATLAKETAMTMLILNHAALILNLLSNKRRTDSSN